MRLTKNITISFLLVVFLLFMFKVFYVLPQKIIDVSTELALLKKEFLIKESLRIKNNILEKMYKTNEINKVFELFFEKDKPFDIVEYIEKTYSLYSDINIVSVDEKYPEVNITIKTQGELKNILKLIHNTDKQNKLFFIDSFDISYNSQKNIWDATISIKTYALSKENEKDKVKNKQ